MSLQERLGRLMRGMRNPVTWLTLTLIGWAVLTTATRQAPVNQLPPPLEARRVLFEQLVRDEPTNREKAREEWAHHRWSQQDAFGALEREHVFDIARQSNTSVHDLFMVIDEGIRSGWPVPDGKHLELNTIPLRPRPMD